MTSSRTPSTSSSSPTLSSPRKNLFPSFAAAAEPHSTSLSYHAALPVIPPVSVPAYHHQLHNIPRVTPLTISQYGHASVTDEDSEVPLAHSEHPAEGLLWAPDLKLEDFGGLAGEGDLERLERLRSVVSSGLHLDQLHPSLAHLREPSPTLSNYSESTCALSTSQTPSRGKRNTAKSLTATPRSAPRNSSSLSDSTDKRKTTARRAEQNRTAQRAFRERRQQYIRTLEERAEQVERVEELLREHKQRLVDLRSLADGLAEERKSWERDRAHWWREREEMCNIALTMGRELEHITSQNAKLRELLSTNSSVEGVPTPILGSLKRPLEDEDSEGLLLLSDPKRPRTSCTSVEQETDPEHVNVLKMLLCTLPPSTDPTENLLTIGDDPAVLLCSDENE
ncbi:hypothetical protein HDU85_001486 [Gaertneriomyces sp. JEL0708]|nr:hypothetical protein HDU85_001486 [Gaertneriomyces sp. JEL0708]